MVATKVQNKSQGKPQKTHSHGANKNQKNISRALSIASCSLIALTPTYSNAVDLESINSSVNKMSDEVVAFISPVEISASVMVYVEENHVAVNEDVILIKKPLDDDNVITAKIIIDVMSGPSPSGAPTSNKIQTMTSPSGNRKTIEPGVEPTYSFRDSRTALLMDWERQTSRLTKWVHSASFSAEYDYYSAGTSTTYSQDFNNRLTTLTTGLGLTFDYIAPVGGTPIGLTSNNIDSDIGEQTKTDVEGMVGVTQILNRYSLLQLNYIHGSANGYLSDPYKLVAVVDDVTGDPYNTHTYYSDKRPSNRTSNIFFINYLRDIKGDVLNFSYRYFSDNWQIGAHTYDAQYNFQLKNDEEFQIRFRYYDQSAASFYHYSFVDGSASNVAKKQDVISDAAINAESISALVDYASADRRLANIKTYTIGVRYRWRTGFKDMKFVARLDHFQQKDKEKRLSTLKGWVAQITARLKF